MQLEQQSIHLTFYLFTYLFIYLHRYVICILAYYILQVGYNRSSTEVINRYVEAQQQESFHFPSLVSSGCILYIDSAVIYISYRHRANKSF